MAYCGKALRPPPGGQHRHYQQKGGFFPNRGFSLPWVPNESTSFECLQTTSFCTRPPLVFSPSAVCLIRNLFWLDVYWESAIRQFCVHFCKHSRGHSCRYQHHFTTSKTSPHHRIASFSYVLLHLWFICLFTGLMANILHCGCGVVRRSAITHTCGEKNGGGGEYLLW